MKITSSSIVKKLVLIPSLIWTIFGVILCIISYNKWYYYTAVVLPSAFVLTSYFIAKAFKLFGGILLLINGLIFTFLTLKVFTFIESIIMLSLFTLPITISGLLILLSSFKLHIPYSKYQYIISKKLPL